MAQLMRTLSAPNFSTKPLPQATPASNVLNPDPCLREASQSYQTAFDISFKRNLDGICSSDNNG
eukprot:4625693-Pleurochrysis_carterae.AAC.1